MIDDSLRSELPPAEVVESKEIEFNRLRCESCNKKLVHLIVTAPQKPVATVANAMGKVKMRPHKSAEPMSYQAECPFCGDKSPPKVVQGSTCPVPEPGVMIVDVETDKNKTLIRTIKRG